MPLFEQDLQTAIDAHEIPGAVLIAKNRTGTILYTQNDHYVLANQSRLT